MRSVIRTTRSIAIFPRVINFFTSRTSVNCVFALLALIEDDEYSRIIRLNGLDLDIITIFMQIHFLPSQKNVFRMNIKLVDFVYFALLLMVRKMSE